MVTEIIYDERYADHRTGSHVESPERVEAIWAQIMEDKLLDREKYRHVKPVPATVEDLELIHDKAMIDRARMKADQAKDGSLQVLDLGDTIVSEESYDVALLAVGGVLTAAEDVLSGKATNAFAFVRPPGHHANRHRSSGFCIFNNIAILAEHLIRNRGLKKIAIFDIDLHHGNGTSEIFYDRNDVLFFSSHQDGRTMYPGSGFVNEIGEGKGKGFNLNAPLVPDSTDDIARTIFTEVIKPVFEQYKPEIILGSIGCDAHYSDPLSGLQFTTQGYGNLVKGYKEIADACCGGKMILTLEGGYKVKVLGKSAVNILQAMAGDDMTHHDKLIESSDSVRRYSEKLLATMKETLKPYWKLE